MEMLELAAELKWCREQIATYEVEREQMQIYYRRAITERDQLCAEIAELRKPDCFRCAYWFACRTLIKDDCGGGDKFVPKRDPVRLYERG